MTATVRAAVVNDIRSGLPKIPVKTSIDTPKMNAETFLMNPVSSSAKCTTRGCRNGDQNHLSHIRDSAKALAVYRAKCDIRSK
jgi:hypothetical protein